jgi:DNA-3-methyladenine glycosylase II
MAASKKTNPPFGHHLRRDAVLAPLILDQHLKPLKKAPDLPLYLYRTIINQQLSTRVGDVIFGRFLTLFNDVPTAEAILAMPVETLRSIGLSAAKASYIRNVAQFHLEHGLTHRRFNNMTDDAAIDYLTQIKGIGRWTAHIFLIAALAREDVFPIDDLILQKVVARLYGIDMADRKAMLKGLEAVAESWKPYRSYASRCIWRWDG